MNDNSKLYTVKWPKSTDHQTKSQSGVMVESNLQGQIALHFYNETRELEQQVQYDMDGNRSSQPRDIVYVREVNDTLLLSEASARQLRDMLNTLFAEPAPKQLM